SSSSSWSISSGEYSPCQTCRGSHRTSTWPKSKITVSICVMVLPHHICRVGLVVTGRYCSGQLVRIDLDAQAAGLLMGRAQCLWVRQGTGEVRQLLPRQADQRTGLPLPGLLLAVRDRPEDLGGLW